MPSIDCTTLALVRTLIPYIIPLIQNADGFPEAYCDVTTALILNDRNRMWQIMGCYNARPRCGMVEGRGHIWVQMGGLNIDFTAHQFATLRPHVQFIDGYHVLLGSDSDLQSLGYTFFPPEQCRDQLILADLSLRMGEFGNCQPGIHWCRC